MRGRRTGTRARAGYRTARRTSRRRRSDGRSSYRSPPAEPTALAAVVEDRLDVVAVRVEARTRRSSRGGSAAVLREQRGAAPHPRPSVGGSPEWVLTEDVSRPNAPVASTRPLGDRSDALRPVAALAAAAPAPVCQARAPPGNAYRAGSSWAARARHHSVTAPSTSHLERPAADVPSDTARAIDEVWKPIAADQLERRNAGLPLAHRLVQTPHVSSRSGRALGPISGLLVDG